MFDVFCPNYREGDNGKTTSGQTGLYNCIAHSVWTDLRYIWPDPDDEYGWPQAVPREDTPEAFLEFYELCGYIACANMELEAGYEKIVIYLLNGHVAHAARQLDDRCWTSKVGDLTDVMHMSLDAMSSDKNGYPACAVRRPWTGLAPQLPPLHPPLTVVVDPEGNPLF